MGYKDLNQIRWYHKFTYWIFIWFLLYKINIISYPPSFLYFFAIIFVINRTISLLINYQKNTINKSVIFFKFLILLGLDIIPFILLYPFKLDFKTFTFNFMFLIIYLTFMNQSIINTFNMYIDHSKYTNKMSVNQYIKHLKQFYLF